MELLIAEKSGWTKSYAIQRGVTQIGSAANNDVVLASSVVAPLHVQVFYSVQQPERCKVMNLGPDVWAKRQGGPQKLASCASLELGAGDELLIDTYQLVFKMPVSSGVRRASASLEASLSFGEAVLRPELACMGVLTIRNTGQGDSCQFQVRLHGLPGDCFRLDPPPMLHPNAQEQCLLYLFHRGLYPTAGFHELTLSVSAPKTYPGEEVVLHQRVYVMPFFEAQLELLDDLPARDVVLEKPQPGSLPQPPVVAPPVEVPTQAEKIAPAPAVSASPVSARPVERVLRLEKNTTDTYWNESEAN